MNMPALLTNVSIRSKRSSASLIRSLRVGYISLHRRNIGIGRRFDGSGRGNDLVVATSERLNKRCPDPLRCSRYDRHLLRCAHDFTDLLTSFYTEKISNEAGVRPRL